MKMSEEMAVRLHRMMWSDMQRELGDCPDGTVRIDFKHEWVKRNFPGESIASDCWLCEYASSVENRSGGPYCMHCPIKWPSWHCNTMDFSYAKEPISEILAVPAKSDKIMDEKAVVYSYYKYREDLLSKASGIPASSAIDDHVKAIQEKAVQQSNISKAYGDTKMELAKASGLKAADAVTDHIKSIQEKAVDYYFAKMPLAKAITTDVDDAFKQYAKEQKAPIFKELAAASGLEELCHDVGKHISAIRKKAAIDQWTTDVNTLKSITKLSYLTVEGFGSAFKAKIEDARVLKDLLNKYKDRLCTASGLDYDKPIDTHLSMIRDSGFAAGKKLAKEEMLKKIEEVLNR